MAAHPLGDDETTAVDLDDDRAAVDETADRLVQPDRGLQSLYDTGPLPVGVAAIPLVAERYQTLGLVGTGSAGRVYRAYDTELDETVALKVLRHELLDAPEAVERFRREVRLARRVTHPNVARTYDIGEHLGQRFMTMQFVDGPSLRDVIRERAPMRPVDVIEVARMLCRGLDAAHAAGVVHRDLKPDNVLVDLDGRALITDFGIALATAARGDAVKLLVGTPAYMAPEQVRGDVQPDGRADLYALGTIMFEMLTGQKAWSGRSAVAVATARLTEAPPDLRTVRADVPAALVALVHRCLAMEARDRPVSAAEVEASLTAIAERLSGVGRVLPASDAPSPARAPTTSTPRGRTVAVVPFATRGDAEIDYIVEGLAEDLIDVLSMTPGLLVRPLGAVQPFADGLTTPRTAGEALGVEVVVSGTVRRTSDSLRIRTRILSVADGFQLWAGRFTCAVGEVLDLSDEMAVAVADALTVSARPDEAVAGASADAAAVDIYLKARHAMRRLWHRDVSEAIALFDAALVRAPDDARILAGAAVARARLAFIGTRPEQRPVADQAADFAARAIALAPGRSEPYQAMAMVHFNAGRPASAMAMLESAIERAPGDAEAHDLLGRILAESGPIERAVTHLRTALALDPRSYNTRWDLVRVHALDGDFASADALVALPVDHSEAAWVRAITRARLDLWRADAGWVDAPLPDGDGDGGVMGALIRTFREIVSTAPTSAHYDALVDYGVSSDRAPRRAVLMFQFAAEVAGRAGDRARCIAALERAVHHGLTDAMWLNRCPQVAWVTADRSDGRVTELVERVRSRLEK